MTQYVHFVASAAVPEDKPVAGYAVMAALAPHVEAIKQIMTDAGLEEIELKPRLRDRRPRKEAA